MIRYNGIAGCLALLVALGAGGGSASAREPTDLIETQPVRILDAASAPARLKADAGPAVPLEMAVGRTMAVPLNEPIADVIVANPAVADVLVKGPRRVYVLGRGPGSTNIFFIARDGEVVLNAEILVSADLAAARRVLETLLPDARIELRALGQSVVMSGTVHSAREAADAQAVVEQFLGGAALGGLAATESKGGPKSEDEAFQTIDKGSERRGSGNDVKVINALRVIGDQQVLLQVKVAEIQRTVLKALTVNTTGDLFDNPFTVGPENVPNAGLSFPVGEPRVGAREVFGGGLLPTIGIDEIAFSVLERQGLVKVLAEPALTAISGETANFLAGGLLPTPSKVDENGNVVVDFREFGISLSFTPVVLANDQLSLRIATEVSRVADENALPFVVPGTTSQVAIKGLTVRRAQSTVTLPSGGSLMIAGLLQNDEINKFEGVPGLMDLPVLGALFRSHEFRTQRTELVIVVKAFRVRPVEFAKDLALPTDGFVPASDIDIYVLGRLYARYGGDIHGDALSLAGPMGYIME